MPRKPTNEKTSVVSATEVLSAQNQPITERTKRMNSNAVSKNEPATLSGQLVPVVFERDTLILVEHNAEPYVVMRPLVTALGLDWASQFVKMGQKFSSTVVEITTVAEDGKLRTMICLPLRKLPGWLYSLNPGKLSANLRPKVVRYQNECDEVLWQHWTGTYVPQHSLANVALSRLNLSYEREHTRISLELSKCTELGLGDVLFDKYSRLSHLIGARIVGLDHIAPGLRQKRLALEGGAA